MRSATGYERKRTSVVCVWSFSTVRFHGDTDRAATVYEGYTPLEPDDVADVVLFCATRPAHVNLLEVLVVPTDQASATMVNR